MDEAEKRRARRAARAHLAGAKGGLELERGAQLVPGSPSDRVSAVFAATLADWRMSGRTLPVYARHEAPGRVIRPTESTLIRDALASGRHKDIGDVEALGGEPTDG